MAFNHYAKMKRILADYKDWYIVQINKPTTATNFRGEKVAYNHYYRVYDASDAPIPFCKFQQLERFAQIMNVTPENLPLIIPPKH